MASGSEGTRPKRGGGERRKRTVYSEEQLDILKRTFQHHPYPGFRMRERLAQLTNIPEHRIQVWFQNRRARAREPKPCKDSDHADRVNPHTHQLQQPGEMQGTPAFPPQNLQYWDSHWGAVSAGWEGAGQLPVAQQANQSPSFLSAAQPQMNFVAPEHAWTPGNLQHGEPACRQNFHLTTPHHYPSSPQTPYGHRP